MVQARSDDDDDDDDDDSVLFREHESFDLYSIRIPEANELSIPISVTDNHVDKKGLGTVCCFH